MGNSEILFEKQPKQKGVEEKKGRERGKERRREGGREGGREWCE
jgi:hypothetical protein